MPDSGDRRPIPIVLAMDIATTTGWAVNCPGAGPMPIGAMGGVVFGSEHLGARGKVGLGGQGLALSRLFKWVREKYQPTHFAYEFPWVDVTKPGQAVTAQVLYGLIMMAESLAMMRGLKPAWAPDRGGPAAYEVHNQTVFSRFSGGSKNLKRDAKKQLTIDICKAWGLAVANDDEADACAVNAVCRWRMGDPTMPVSPMFARLGN